MKIHYNNKILIWITAILVVTNISTIGTIIYQTYFKQNEQEQIKIPNNRFGRFFRDELNLNYEQHQQFRNFRRKFHKNANILKNQMQTKRNEMIFQLGKEKSDTAYLHELAKEIGNLHEELKHLTFEYYLNMKSVCDKEQKEKLHRIFKVMINEKAEIKMPKKRYNFQK